MNASSAAKRLELLGSGAGRATSYLLLFALVSLAGVAGAQTCTTEYTSGTPLSTISSAINSATPGAVICLQRGSAWSTSGIAFVINATKSSSNPVTVCASTSGSCSASGAANPRINLTGSGNTGCFDFNAPALGYTIKNVDCFGSLDNESPAAISIERGVSYVRFEGGVYDTVWQTMWFDSGSGPFADHLTLGICGNPIEIRKTPNNPGDAGGVFDGYTPDRHASWGSMTNSSMSVWIHDFWGYKGTFGTDHMIDLSHNGSATSYLNASNNVTIECSRFEQDANGSTNWMGTMIKAALGRNITLRDSIFDLGGSNCWPTAGFLIGSHNAKGNVEGWDGADVYNNYFFGSCTPIIVNFGHNVRIHDNYAALQQNQDSQRGFFFADYQFSDGYSDDLTNQDISIYNNTVVRTGNVREVGSGFGLIAETNQGGRTPGTRMALWNNILVDTDSVDAKIMTMQQTTCNDWGPNGAWIRNNFVYTPNDSSPSLGDACSGDDDWIKSGSNPAAVGDGWNTPPGFLDSSSNFRITTQSRVSGQGNTASINGISPPTKDYDKLARPSPPSIGAFDAGGTGTLALEPPTLISPTN